MKQNFSTNPFMMMAEIIKETIPFLFKNKLWVGFFSQKTVLYITILLGLSIPVALFDLLDSKSDSLATNVSTMNLGVQSDLLSSFNFFSGTQKYLLVILFSMLITYFMHKTLDVLIGFQGKITLKDYFTSQVRIILVSVRNWAIELIIGIAASIVFGIFGPDWLEDIIKFLVGAFFIGYLFFDGFYSMFHLKIKEASTRINSHIPAVMVLGICVKLVFLIPFVGPIIGSVMGAIAATWYLQTTDAPATSISQTLL